MINFRKIRIVKKIIFLLVITMSLACCNDDDNITPTIPVLQLPPETQIGANTFGCLIDGEVFKPGLTNNSYNCFYQLVDNEYYFLVTANNSNSNITKGVFVGTEKKTISQGQTLNLFERTDGNAWATYFLNTDPYTTNTLNTGELKITKLDFTNNIVSGTFWYDIQDNLGGIHRIREGRFDMQFTQ